MQPSCRGQAGIVGIIFTQSRNIPKLLKPKLQTPGTSPCVEPKSRKNTNSRKQRGYAAFKTEIKAKGTRRTSCDYMGRDLICLPVSPSAASSSNDLRACQLMRLPQGATAVRGASGNRSNAKIFLGDRLGCEHPFIQKLHTLTQKEKQRPNQIPFKDSQRPENRKHFDHRCA